MEARGHPQTLHMVTDPTSKSKPQPRQRDTQALKRGIGGRGRLTKKKKKVLGSVSNEVIWRCVGFLIDVVFSF